MAPEVRAQGILGRATTRMPSPPRTALLVCRWVNNKILWPKKRNDWRESCICSLQSSYSVPCIRFTTWSASLSPMFVFGWVGKRGWKRHRLSKRHALSLTDTPTGTREAYARSQALVLKRTATLGNPRALPLGIWAHSNLLNGPLAWVIEKTIGEAGMVY